MATPSLTIRKLSKARFPIPNPVRSGALSKELAEFFRSLIEVRRTLEISRGTDSGKTTLLNALTDFIPDLEHIVTSEDLRELRIEKPNVLAAKCRKDAHEGRGNFDDLLKASLRWKPDRIILSEQRRVDARPVQQAGDAFPSAGDTRRLACGACENRADGYLNAATENAAARQGIGSHARLRPALAMLRVRAGLRRSA